MIKTRKTVIATVCSVAVMTAVAGTPALASSAEPRTGESMPEERRGALIGGILGAGVGGPIGATVGVILGGGEFVGGRISPAGAVIGAITLTLAASFLSFLRLPPDWQIGAQGGILIIVLALRAIINRGEARR